MCYSWTVFYHFYWSIVLRLDPYRWRTKCFPADWQIEWLLWSVCSVVLGTQAARRLQLHTSALRLWWIRTRHELKLHIRKWNDQKSSWSLWWTRLYNMISSPDLINIVLINKHSARWCRDLTPPKCWLQVLLTMQRNTHLGERAHTCMCVHMHAFAHSQPISGMNSPVINVTFREQSGGEQWTKTGFSVRHLG